MSPSPPPADDGPDAPAPGAELRTHTVAGATRWQTQTPALSLWKGEVGLPDRLRVELRDGRVDELRLAAGHELRLGRLKPGMSDPPEIAHDLFLSSRAATLRHDGLRWWLRRRPECHEKVPTVVGARTLGAGEEAPLVHGTFLQVGQLRATLVDRRYVTPIVPAGAVDSQTGLLGRVGFEHEIASHLALGVRGLLLFVAPPADGPGRSGAAALALHRAFPRAPAMHDEGLGAALLADGAVDPSTWRPALDAALAPPDVGLVIIGTWPLVAGPVDAGKELELALSAAHQACRAPRASSPLALRDGPFARRVATGDELVAAAADPRRTTLLFAIEETPALAAVGAEVVPALEQELAAVVVARAPRATPCACLAPGVVGACLPPGCDAESLAVGVQREWHARPPVADGHVEFPRTLCWQTITGDPRPRALDLARECADPHGVLHALAGGLPYPVAGRVALALTSGSAVERIKLLFDVLEGAWRLVAHVLAAAYFSAPSPPGGAPDEGLDLLVSFARSTATRHAYPLGKWRELARLCARAFPRDDDPIGHMARELFRLRPRGEDTLEELGNQLHPVRNHFAHNVYPEARALHDLAAFEQTTREFLRALRPLCAWTLVTVEKSDPDLFGETQTVDYVDHTGPSEAGTRRRVGWKSPLRLANVVYLVRWRDGLAVPLEPFLRRRPNGHAFELYWLSHLPRAGACAYETVVRGGEATFDVEERRLSPRLRALLRRT